MTPTEAAAVGVIAVFITIVLNKKLTVETFKVILKKCVSVTCMVLFIIIGAQVLSFFFVQSGINRGLIQWVIDKNLSKEMLLVFMVGLYFVLGCLMDGISMIYLTMPLFFPIIESMGIDKIWFGVFIVILIELAQITPPVGLNLFVLQGISGEPIEKIVEGCIPYFFILLLSILIFTVWPNLVLWLPSRM